MYILTFTIEEKQVKLDLHKNLFRIRKSHNFHAARKRRD